MLKFIGAMISGLAAMSASAWLAQRQKKERK